MVRGFKLSQFIGGRELGGSIFQKAVVMHATTKLIFCCIMMLATTYFWDTLKQCSTIF